MSKKLPVLELVAPSVPLKLTLKSGRTLEFDLAFDYNALAAVESQVGFNMLRSVSIFKALNATNLSVLLWGAIQTNHEEYAGELGLKAIRSFMTKENSQLIEDTVTEAYVQSLSDEAKEFLKKKAEEMRPEPTGAPVPLEQAPTPKV